MTLTQRSDFLLAARAARMPTPAFLLQARKRGTDDAPADGGPRDGGPGDGGDDAIRVGFTCSKKVGNAVARNRAKRRLREIARAILPTQGRAGWDYVLIGRKEATATHDFKAMQADLSRALRKVHP